MPIAGAITNRVHWRIRHWIEDTRKLWTPYYLLGDARDNAFIRTLVAGLLAVDGNGVDIGSNDGLFLRDFIRCAPRGHHMAIEPLPALADRLRRSFPTVTVHEVALSDHAGEAPFCHVVSQSSYSGLRTIRYHTPQTVRPIRVRVAPLDDLWPPDRPLSLIKLDVEGAELEVLRGAARTIRRWHPAIVFEHGGAASAFGTSPRDVHSLLTDYDLRVFSLNGDGPHDLPAFEIRCGSVDRSPEWNFLART